MKEVADGKCPGLVSGREAGFHSDVPCYGHCPMVASIQTRAFPGRIIDRSIGASAHPGICHHTHTAGRQRHACLCCFVMDHEFRGMECEKGRSRVKKNGQAVVVLPVQAL